MSEEKIEKKIFKELLIIFIKTMFGIILLSNFIVSFILLVPQITSEHMNKDLLLWSQISFWTLAIYFAVIIYFLIRKMQKHHTFSENKEIQINELKNKLEILEAKLAEYEE